MFLAEKPCRLDGRNRGKYKKRKRNKPIAFENVNLDDEESMACYKSHIEALSLDDISSNDGEWTDTDQSRDVYNDDDDSDANSIEEDNNDELCITEVWFVYIVTRNSIR